MNIASRSPMVVCEFDDFNTDNPLNRIFKLAMITLLRNVHHNETQRLLRHGLVFFDEVRSTSISPYQLDSIYFNRNNQRYYASYILAKLILAGSSSLYQAGLNNSFSILFKMNELFEEYIACLVGQIVSDVTIKDRRYKLLVNENTGYQNFQLEPDILINRNSERQLIIDTKWKKYNPKYSSHGVQRNDLYQMYAYLTRYDKVHTVNLLYPYDFESDLYSGECLNVWHLDGNQNKKLKCYIINYENEEKALKELELIIQESISVKNFVED